MGDNGLHCSPHSHYAWPLYPSYLLIQILATDPFAWPVAGVFRWFIMTMSDQTHLTMVQQVASWVGVKVATTTGSSPSPPAGNSGGGGGTCDLWPSCNQQPSRDTAPTHHPHCSPCIVTTCAVHKPVPTPLPATRPSIHTGESGVVAVIDRVPC